MYLILMIFFKGCFQIAELNPLFESEGRQGVVDVSQA